MTKSRLPPRKTLWLFKENDSKTYIEPFNGKSIAGFCSVLESRDDGSLVIENAVGVSGFLISDEDFSSPKQTAMALQAFLSVKLGRTVNLVPRSFGDAVAVSFPQTEERWLRNLRKPQIQHLEGPQIVVLDESGSVLRRSYFASPDDVRSGLLLRKQAILDAGGTMWETELPEVYVVSKEDETTVVVILMRGTAAELADRVKFNGRGVFRLPETIRPVDVSQSASMEKFLGIVKAMKKCLQKTAWSVAYKRSLGYYKTEICMDFLQLRLGDLKLNLPLLDITEDWFGKSGALLSNFRDEVLYRLQALTAKEPVKLADLAEAIDLALRC